MKVLIVDDEKLIRDVIKEYCINNNYDTLEASNGTEAIELASKADIIIMDIMMPKMDGFTAYKKIKEKYDIPTIMLSARGEEYDKLNGFDLGIDDYVTKPFSPKELMARINAVIKRYKGEETSDATLDTSDQLDYWICPDFDDTWVSNIKVPGLIQYLDYFNKTKIPILGTMTQHLEMSIKELKVREVSDSEFALPTDITFTLVSNQATAESKLKKDHKKWTKEHGKKVGEDIQTRGAAKTKGDWDF